MCALTCKPQAQEKRTTSVANPGLIRLAGSIKVTPSTLPPFPVVYRETTLKRKFKRKLKNLVGLEAKSRKCLLRHPLAGASIFGEGASSLSINFINGSTSGGMVARCP